MNILYRFTALSIAVASITVVTGCISSDSGSQGSIRYQNPPIREIETAEVEPVVAEPTVYQLNEVASAGDIDHVVTSLEFLETIPAENTISSYSAIAEDAPAADGFQWVHLTGTVTNNTNSTQSVNSLTFSILDEVERKYEAMTTDTVLYVDNNKAPVSITVQPTQTVEWEAYFLVPSDANTLTLVASDLNYVPEDTVSIALREVEIEVSVYEGDDIDAVLDVVEDDIVEEVEAPPFVR